MNDPMQGVFRGFDIAASGLRAELQRSEIVVANLSNMHDTGNVSDPPYRRKAVVFEEVMESVVGGQKMAGGVNIKQIYEDRVTPYRRFYDESHPDAFHDEDNPDNPENGWVYGTNVDLFQEMVDLMMIERSYQTKLASLRSYRNMVRNTISNIGRR
jgi:flagellar basal-body rod protein FlgC